MFVAYVLLGRRLSRSSVTGPMLFMVGGILAAVDVLGRGEPIADLTFVLESGVVQGMLEATLAIVLFTDAVSIDLRAARSGASLPSRLLGIGMPLTIVFGIVAAMLVFPEAGFWPAFVIAVILAPTDAALGQAVVTNSRVPIGVRQALGIESGLNDGLAVPLLAVAIAGTQNEMHTAAEIVTVFAREIGLAIIVGLVVGLGGQALVRYASRRSWASDEGRQVGVLVFAVLSFSLAAAFHCSGFIAAFVAGLAFGVRIRREHPDICDFADGFGHLLTMLAFFVFGSLILVPALEGTFSWWFVLYAVLSLTVIRMVPVAISLVGSSLRARSQLFMAWFGPRGLASLVFVGTVVYETNAEDTQEIVSIAALTVALSVILHGVTAWPASVRYARWYRTERAASEVPMSEETSMMDVPPGRYLRMARRLPPLEDGQETGE